MTFTMRIIFFFCTILLTELSGEPPAKVGKKSPSALVRGTAASGMVSAAVLLTGFCYNKVSGAHFPGVDITMRPFGIGLGSLAIVGLLLLVLRKHPLFSLQLRQAIALFSSLISISLAADLAASTSFFYTYTLSVGFFFLSTVLLLGIQDRIQTAPLPAFLKGRPIQLLALLLIFLSFSFLRGVFFDSLF